MSNRTSPIAFWMLGASALVLVCALGLPMLARPTNCGGNSAALAACKSISICFRLISAERGDEPVSIASLTAAERDYFKQVAGLSWLRDSKVLVTRSRVRVGESGGKDILAVCDTGFDNVPRRMFGRAPFTHAVAYTDGTTALLSGEDFRHLDLHAFVDVRTIQTGKVELDGAANGGQPSRSETNSTSSTAGSRR